MTDCREVISCRVCGAALEPVLHLGEQRLAGRFPAAGEAEPPAFPLLLCRCGGCGLAQLGHTVNPELMFRTGYGYRSNQTATMRAHLKGMAEEALALLGREPKWVMDVGCNTGELLRNLPCTAERVGVDPADVAEEAAGECMLVRQFWPARDKLPGANFDIVFTAACFYDADDPVAFARAVRDRLADGGLWCVEVADCAAMVENLSWDAVLHEHLCYYDMRTLCRVLADAGLAPIRHSRNGCNGGSLRVYARRAENTVRPLDEPDHDWAGFADRVAQSADALEQYLHDCRRKGPTVHLLGASTKSNTVLQFANVTPDLVQAASDRDPRKAGKRTPGTGIPIVSEEKSRAMRPDVYLSFLQHFRGELVEREREFLDGGGKVVFALPKLEVVSR